MRKNSQTSGRQEVGPVGFQTGDKQAAVSTSRILLLLLLLLSLLLLLLLFIRFALVFELGLGAAKIPGDLWDLVVHRRTLGFRVLGFRVLGFGV